MQTELATTFKSPTFEQRFQKLNRNDSLVMAEEMKHLTSIMDRNDSLAKCEPNSVISSMYAVASIGLSLNPVLQQCTIVPRWDRNAKQNVASYMPMYRGLIKLAYETETLDTFSAQNVYQQDEFDVTLGTKAEIKHKPNLKAKQGSEDNPYVLTYVVAYLKGAVEPITEIVYAYEMYKIRESSDSYTDRNGKVRASSPWAKWPGEMYKKAALKRAQKRWPQKATPEWERFAQAVEEDNKIDRREDDIEAKPVITLDQQTVIKDKLKEASIDLGYFLDAFEVAELSDLPEDRYEEAIQRCEKRIEALAKKA